MELFNIQNWKTGNFFNQQEFNKPFTEGDIVTIDAKQYFVTHCEFACPLNPMIIVWPAKLSFPFDFIENSRLFEWLKSHLKGLVIEASNSVGEIIKGKVIEIYIGKIIRILHDHSSNAISHNYYLEDCIDKVKILLFNNDIHLASVDIPLDQCTKIEIKN